MLHTDYKFGEVINLKSQIEVNPTKVAFKEIFSNENGGVVLLGFEKDQELAEHLAPAELMITVLEGEIEFSVNGKPLILKDGDFLLVGKDVAHSVKAHSNAKVMLTKIKA